MEFSILKQIKLAKHHTPTNKVQQYVLGKPAKRPKALQIVKYLDDKGYYLLYLDEKGEEITDTYYESIASAMEQAEYEFNVKNDEWR